MQWKVNVVLYNINFRYVDEVKVQYVGVNDVLLFIV